MKKFNEAIKEARKGARMTQLELAEALGWGQTRISNYELGKREPSQEDLSKIAAALGITEERLLGLPETPNSIELSDREREHIMKLRSMPERDQEKYFQIYEQLLALKNQ